mmetsp:Transcript_44122/g.79209  ORF Transcript_44122/g.79209 Transcript_44122/m.79209 type:complete len:352 (-) Transcript_44122:2853-3908(-)
MWELQFVAKVLDPNLSALQLPDPGCEFHDAGFELAGQVFDPHLPRVAGGPVASEANFVGPEVLVVDPLSLVHCQLQRCQAQAPGIVDQIPFIVAELRQLLYHLCGQFVPCSSQCVVVGAAVAALVVHFVLDCRQARERHWGWVLVMTARARILGTMAQGVLVLALFCPGIWMGPRRPRCIVVDVVRPVCVNVIALLPSRRKRWAAFGRRFEVAFAFWGWGVRWWSWELAFLPFEHRGEGELEVNAGDGDAALLLLHVIMELDNVLADKARQDLLSLLFAFICETRVLERDRVLLPVCVMLQILVAQQQGQWRCALGPIFTQAPPFCVSAPLEPLVDLCDQPFAGRNDLSIV